MYVRICFSPLQKAWRRTIKARHDHRLLSWLMNGWENCNCRTDHLITKYLTVLLKINRWSSMGCASLSAVQPTQKKVEVPVEFVSPATDREPSSIVAFPHISHAHLPSTFASRIPPLAKKAEPADQTDPTTSQGQTNRTVLKMREQAFSSAKKLIFKDQGLPSSEKNGIQPQDQPKHCQANRKQVLPAKITIVAERNDNEPYNNWNDAVEVEVPPQKTSLNIKIRKGRHLEAPVFESKRPTNPSVEHSSIHIDLR